MEKNKVEVKKEGVSTIHLNGEFIGIIYNDMQTKSKRLYWAEEMSQEEIGDLLTGELSTRSLSSAIAKKGV